MSSLVSSIIWLKWSTGSRLGSVAYLWQTQAVYLTFTALPASSKNSASLETLAAVDVYCKPRRVMAESQFPKTTST